MSHDRDYLDEEDEQPATRRGDRSALVAMGLSEALRSRAGRAWLWSLLSGAGLDANTYTNDPIQSAYLAGRRSVAVDLVAEIRAKAPDLYLTLIRESLEK